ncbi:hypothetical protein EJ03DRAFT_140847 [Teratosphaeria nubilosa]|uniref:Uncharacterized protein n=1 Tax=Teratosphaeria nubilosa TaxID=161662 RepID=A0A6G1L569_9PEZI|nr:hypothetical protein EJ03DRAFT_140847 [Teratosphaeria nubilosa]
MQSEDDESDDELILDIGKPWRKGPTPAQFTFLVPTDKNGGTEEKHLDGPYDFFKTRDVKAANKLRSQAIRRAKQRAWGKDDYPKARPSVEDRKYLDKHNELIKKLYEDYAKKHNNTRMSTGQLAAAFNRHFPNEEDRTDASLASHIDRRPELKAVKLKYSLA